MKSIERLHIYIEYKGLKPTPFGTSIGLSNGYLGKMKKRNADLGEGVLLKIIENCPDLSIEWLMIGKGEMIKNHIEVDEPSEVYKLRTDRNYDEQQIPLYDLEATAGLVSLFRNQGDSTPLDFIKIPNLPKCDGAVSVTGDSMYPLLKSGDIVMYKELHNEINNIFFGEMYLLSIDLSGDEYVSVKWVQRSDKGEKYIRLVSENQHHQPKDIPLKKVKALALVKASIRINSMR